MGPVKELDLETRDALIKLVKRIKSQRNVEKIFSWLLSTVLKFSKTFIELKGVKNRLSFGRLRATPKKQGHTLLKYLKIWEGKHLIIGILIGREHATPICHTER